MITTMSHSKIDEKDLMPFKFSEYVIGGVFYRKEEDGSFSRCRITEFELKVEGRKRELRLETEELSKAGRLFRRINKPFMGFE